MNDFNPLQSIASAEIDGSDFTKKQVAEMIVRGGGQMIGKDFSYSSLKGAQLAGGAFIGANFRHANLTGACLDGAILIGADFTGATLVGATFRGAHITNAKFDQYKRPSCFTGAIGSDK